MIILIILVVLAVIFIITFAMGGNNSDIKKLRTILDKGIGAGPEENQRALSSATPSFELVSQNLNPKSIGRKFQQLRGENKKRIYKIWLYYDEQLRCEDYTIERTLDKYTYNHLKETFPKTPEVTHHWWGQ